MRLHILPEVSRGNAQSNTKFKSKVIVLPKDLGNTNYLNSRAILPWPVLLIDSFARFLLLFWLLATNSTKYIGGRKKKTGNFNRSECLGSPHTGYGSDQVIQRPCLCGEKLSRARESPSQSSQL